MRFDLWHGADWVLMGFVVQTPVGAQFMVWARVFAFEAAPGLGGALSPNVLDNLLKKMQQVAEVAQAKPQMVELGCRNSMFVTKSLGLLALLCRKQPKNSQLTTMWQPVIGKSI